MTALKAYEVSRFLERPDLMEGVFLVYGSDSGLVYETAKKLSNSLNKSGDAEFITLDGDSLAKDIAPLGVEMSTISMFGGKRIIRVRNAGNKLAAFLKGVGSVPGVVVIFESDNLAPKDALRSVVEGMKHGRAMPCFADSEETISDLIKRTFAREKIAIDPDVESTLREILGNDREITRRELEKLCLFAFETKKITRVDVLNLCADNGVLAVDAIIDSAGVGDHVSLNKAMIRARDNGVDSQKVLIMSGFHFSNLRRLRVKVDQGHSPSDALDSSKPRPHFSRKNIMLTQLRNLTDVDLAAIGSRILTATYESRRNPQLGSVIVSRCLMSICDISARASKR